MDAESRAESAGRPAETRYCPHCDEPLAGGAEPGSCPRCNRPYDPKDLPAFTRVPAFRAVRFWLPAYLLAVVSGVATYATLLAIENDKGLALFVAVPVSVGAILGFAAKARPWILVGLLLAAVLSVVGVLVMLDLSGLFCGVIGIVVFMAPGLVGVLIGWVLRIFLKASSWDQRFYLSLLAILALPYAADCIERLFPGQPVIATVKTRAAFRSTGRRAFDSIVFYEEVKHRVPFLLRLALPRPVRSEGKKTAEGDIVRCVYEHGFLSKRITRLEKGKLLAFEVIEQKLHFERDVQLLGGSFEVESANGAGSEAASVLLTTRYRALLHPRWLWEPIEREVVHTLHEHVLEGMRREAEGTAPRPAQGADVLSSADRR